VFPEGTTQAYGPPMVDIMRNGAIEAAFEAGKLVQPVRNSPRPWGPEAQTADATPCGEWHAQAALYYSARVGLGWELEANPIRQTSLMCGSPLLAAVQLCPTLRPADFKSGEEMANAAKQAMLDAYAVLERRYKAWPSEELAPAEQQ
jgi:hypothetical protein